MKMIKGIYYPIMFFVCWFGIIVTGIFYPFIAIWFVYQSIKTKIFEGHDQR